MHDSVMRRERFSGSFDELPDNLCDKVAAFHEKFCVPSANAPTLLDPDTLEFRMKLMSEELREYREASEAGDLEGQLDALVDLVYVTLGTAYVAGLPFAEAFRRVHSANMQKVRASDASESKRGSGLDVVKPEGWEPASLADLVGARP